ncbi:MAG TPA: GNAT family N-acetyltransferase [bacterium]|nr:GNAT family N-acetyltransferase [bacterium]
MTHSAFLTLKEPSRCSPGEIDGFCRIVLGEGQVSRERFEKRVRKARLLAFLTDSDGGDVIAAAAVKRPDPGYQKEVFGKADVSGFENKTALELGWVVVSPAHQRNGHCGRLVEAVLQDLESEDLYATSKVDNLPMHKVLGRFGFLKVGRSYVSKNRSGEIALFVRLSSRP